MRKLGYWADKYCWDAEDEFIEGLVAGITEYAVWEDGLQRVGVQRRLLVDVVEEIINDFGYKGRNIFLVD
jgi:hypothetical protein